MRDGTTMPQPGLTQMTSAAGAGGGGSPFPWPGLTGMARASGDPVFVVPPAACSTMKTAFPHLEIVRRGNPKGEAGQNRLHRTASRRRHDEDWIARNPRHASEPWPGEWRTTTRPLRQRRSSFRSAPVAVQSYHRAWHWPPLHGPLQATVAIGAQASVFIPPPLPPPPAAVELTPVPPR